MVSGLITGTLVLTLSIFIICPGKCCLISAGFSTIGVGSFGVISIFVGITVELVSIAFCFIGIVASFLFSLFSEIAISFAMSVGLITLILLLCSTLFFCLISVSVFTSEFFSSIGLSSSFSSIFFIIFGVLYSCFVSSLVSLDVSFFVSSSFLSTSVSISSPIDFVSDSFSLPSSGSVSISMTLYTSSKLVSPAIHLPKASCNIVIVLFVYTMSLNSSFDNFVLFRAFLISSSNSSTSWIAIRPL